MFSVQLKSDLQCKDFQWLMENIYEYADGTNYIYTLKNYYSIKNIHKKLNILPKTTFKIIVMIV